jgi:hypothetical protein
MEELLVMEGYHYTYRSPALTVSSTKQTATISTLHMDGFSTTISFGNEVEEGYKQQVS